MARVDRQVSPGSGFIGPHQQRTMSPEPAGDPVEIAAPLYVAHTNTRAARSRGEVVS